MENAREAPHTSVASPALGEEEARPTNSVKTQEGGRNSKTIEPVSDYKPMNQTSQGFKPKGLLSRKNDKLKVYTGSGKVPRKNKIAGYLPIKPEEAARMYI